MAVGNPAVPHSINSEGLKRRGFTPEQIRNLRNAYRILYRSDLPLAAAVEQLSELATAQPELRLLIEFIAARNEPGTLMSTEPEPAPTARALRVAIVAGESSGDALGAALIEALRDARAGA